MTAAFVFQLLNGFAMLGWLVLVAGVVLRKPWLRDVAAGQAWPTALSLIYTLLIGAFFFAAPGGFDSLAHVQQLFTVPWVALGGWAHYLAFDLFMGAMIAREVTELGLPRISLVMLLPLTFLFGPIGYLAFMALRLSFSRSEASSG